MVHPLSNLHLISGSHLSTYLVKDKYLHFHFAFAVSITQILAHMLDSLVRVSRRVDEHHFVKIIGGKNFKASDHSVYPMSKNKNFLKAKDKILLFSLLLTGIQTARKMLANLLIYLSLRKSNQIQKAITQQHIRKHDIATFLLAVS